METFNGLYIDRLVLQNFRTFGNQKTSVAFSQYHGLTCIRGYNNDAQAADSRNGCGKSAILEALALALTGKAVKSARGLTRLINRVNKKGLVVELDFWFKGELCRIERGLNPSFCRFFCRPRGQSGDIGQFEVTMREKPATEALIYDKLKIDIELFKLVICSMAGQESFVNLDSPVQKSLMETLFDQKRLTEKGAALKKAREALETTLATEKAVNAERLRSYQNALQHRDNVTAQYAAWGVSQQKKIDVQAAELEQIMSLDASAEISLWETITDIEQRLNDANNRIVIASTETKRISGLISTHRALEGSIKQWLNSAADQNPTKYISEWDAYEKAQVVIRELTQQQNALLASLSQIQRSIKTVEKEIEAFNDQCPTCGQLWPDHEKMHEAISVKQTSLTGLKDELIPLSTDLMRVEIGIGEERTVKPPVSTMFKKRDDALRHTQDCEHKNIQLKEVGKLIVDAMGELEAQEAVTFAINAERAKLSDELAQVRSLLKTGSKEQALGLPATVEAGTTKLEQLLAETNPFEVLKQQAEDVESQQPDLSGIEEMELRIKEYKTLEGLCTRKDSPLRSDILKKWIPRLNQAIQKYLLTMEYPYTVVFNGDLSVDVLANGEVTDFDDMSNGEAKRVDLALSWAFREIFEELHYPINIYAVDEQLDSGLCPAGVVKGATVLKDFALLKNRSVFLITHRQDANELIDQEINVVKEHGFSVLVG